MYGGIVYITICQWCNQALSIWVNGELVPIGACLQWSLKNLNIWSHACVILHEHLWNISFKDLSLFFLNHTRTCMIACNTPKSFNHICICQWLLVGKVDRFSWHFSFRSLCVILHMWTSLIIPAEGQLRPPGHNQSGVKISASSVATRIWQSVMWPRQ